MRPKGERSESIPPLATNLSSALNLMFGSPARLSVDLDFNYIGDEDCAQMQSDRAEVERATVIIGEGQGYRVEHSRDARAGRKIYLSYASSVGTPDRIEVDLNFPFRVPLGEITTRPLWQPPRVANPEVESYSCGTSGHTAASTFRIRAGPL